MRVAAILRALIAAALAAGCSGEGGGRDSLLRVAAVAPGGDAESAPAAAERIAGEAAGAGLLRFDAAGEVAPGLARSWLVSGDGLQYVFRVRPDARWQDGTPLTAAQAARALDRLRKRSTAFPLAPLLPPVDGVSAPAPSVVEVRLARPAAGLLPLLAHPASALVTAKRAAAGPYAREAAKGTDIRLTARQGSGAAIGRVTVRGAGVDAAIARFRGGEADIVTGATLSGLIAAREAGARSGALRVEPAWGYWLIDFGEQAGALTDERLRLAMSLAVDRAALGGRLFAVPQLLPQAALLPPGMDGRTVTPDWAGEAVDARREAAVALAREAGVASETPLTLTVDAPDSPEHAAMLQALAAMWEPLGLTLRARVRAPAEHARFVAAGRFQAALVERIAPLPTARAFLDPLRCGRIAAWRCNAEADLALDRYAAAGNSEERARAQWLLLARTPVIPLVASVRWSLVSPRVAGWVDNPQGAHPLVDLSLTAAMPAHPWWTR